MCTPLTEHGDAHSGQLSGGLQTTSAGRSRSERAFSQCRSPIRSYPFKAPSTSQKRQGRWLAGLLRIRPGVPMDSDAFWRIVDGARSNATDDKNFLRRIEAHLRKLKPDELIKFERQFEKIHTESCSWNLWGAAYLMKGGCSDDGFDYFRAWLMAQGRRTFEKAVADADTLAILPDPEGGRSRRNRELELEEFMHLAREIYEEKTGQEMPESESDFVQGVNWRDFDVRWNFNDPTEMKRRYPKLFAKYGRG